MATPFIGVYATSYPAYGTPTTVPALPTPAAPTPGTPTSSTIPLTTPVVADATGYRFQLAKNAGFTTGLLTSPDLTAANGQTTPVGYTFTGLTASTTYYRRVMLVGDGTTHADSQYSPAGQTATAASGVRQAITAPPYAKLEVDPTAYDNMVPLGTTIGNGCKRTASDGTKILYPEGSGATTYPNAYPNDGDMVLTALAALGIFTADDAKGQADYFLTRVPVSGPYAYMAPEYVGANGSVGWSAQGAVGPSGDRNPYCVRLVFKVCALQNSIAYYQQYADLLYHMLTDGMRLVNGVPYEPPLAFDTPGQCPRPRVAFNDSEWLDKNATHQAVIYWNSLHLAADLANRASDAVRYNDYLDRADVVRDFVNTQLWDATYGLYKANNGNASAQRDVWASCAAVHYGLATPAIALKVSQTLVAKENQWYYNGGSACIIKDTHAQAGVACWPAYVKGNTAGLGGTGQAQVTADPTQSVGMVNQFGQYQNFGKWGTYMDTVLTTIAISAPARAKQMFTEYATRMVSTNGVETFSANGFSQVPYYGASMAGLGWVTRGTPVAPTPTSDPNVADAYARAGLSTAASKVYFAGTPYESTGQERLTAASNFVIGLKNTVVDGSALWDMLDALYMNLGDTISGMARNIKVAPGATGGDGAYSNATYFDATGQGVAANTGGPNVVLNTMHYPLPARLADDYYFIYHTTHDTRTTPQVSLAFSEPGLEEHALIALNPFDNGSAIFTSHLYGTITAPVSNRLGFTGGGRKNDLVCLDKNGVRLNEVSAPLPSDASFPSASVGLWGIGGANNFDQTAFSRMAVAGIGRHLSTNQLAALYQLVQQYATDSKCAV